MSKRRPRDGRTAQRGITVRGGIRLHPAGRGRSRSPPSTFGNVVQHMAALPHREVAGTLATVRASGANPAVKLAFEFLVLTAARSGEVRGTRWNKMDTQARVCVSQHGEHRHRRCLRTNRKPQPRRRQGPRAHRRAAAAGRCRGSSTRALHERLRRVLVTRKRTLRVAGIRLVDPPARIQPAVAQFNQASGFQGFCPLDEVTRDNVAGLKLAWSIAIRPGNHQTTPLVHDGVMFLANPGNVVQAIDAATGDVIVYRARLPEDVRPGPTRTLALYGDKLFLARADAVIVGLDARTGEEVWQSVKGDHTQGFRQNAGPVIANGVVAPDPTAAPSAPTPLPSPASTEPCPLPPSTSDSPLIRVQENWGRLSHGAGLT